MVLDKKYLKNEKFREKARVLIPYWGHLLYKGKRPVILI